MRKFIFLFLITLLTASPLFAVLPQAPLPADQAFIFSITSPRSREVIAEWRLMPGYYLYAKKIQITFEPNIPAEIHFPESELKYDGRNKVDEIYSGHLRVPILLQTDIQSVHVRIDYQGCSTSGFCYPPEQKRVVLTLGKGSFLHPELQSLLTHQNDVQRLLYSPSISRMWLIFVGLGLLLAFTPCVFPMIPILTGIILGQRQMSTRQAAGLSFTYVLGVAIAYALLGYIAASLGHSLQVWLQKPWMISFTSAVFVLLAISLFGYYDLSLPSRLQTHLTRWSHRPRGGTYAGVFLMGIVSTFVVSPCVTAPLVGVLMYVGETGNQMLGASVLFAMGVGMGIPLLLIGLSAGRWLPRSGPWMTIVKKLFGFLMLVMAVWLFSRIISHVLAHILYGVLVLGAIIFLLMSLARYIGRNKVERRLGFWIGSTVLLFLLSGVLILNKIGDFIHAYHITATTSFIPVNSIAEVNQQLLIARKAHQPVIVDFYADWCESCVAMDRDVFEQPKVQQVLRSYVLLRVDLSQNSVTDERVMRFFHVIAPPTVLLFDADGRERHALRIVGEISANEFLARLQAIQPTIIKED